MLQRQSSMRIVGVRKASSLHLYYVAGRYSPKVMSIPLQENQNSTFFTINPVCVEGNECYRLDASVQQGHDTSSPVGMHAISWVQSVSPDI